MMIQIIRSIEATRLEELEWVVGIFETMSRHDREFQTPEPPRLDIVSPEVLKFLNNDSFSVSKKKTKRGWYLILGPGDQGFGSSVLGKTQDRHAYQIYYETARCNKVGSDDCRSLRFWFRLSREVWIWYCHMLSFSENLVSSSCGTKAGLSKSTISSRHQFSDFWSHGKWCMHGLLTKCNARETLVCPAARS
ncbi:hypothetical protein DL98DRAFT_537244 [Cadophora sp. DSE1049]|nr:hypothetical protein DL98DRAFT_537244 [Cadophora sp. DSE1049]